jgi:hypothetical protein
MMPLPTIYYFNPPHTLRPYGTCQKWQCLSDRVIFSHTTHIYMQWFWHCGTIFTTIVIILMVFLDIYAALGGFTLSLRPVRP